METFFFAIVALVAIVSGILVVKCRNPINSALSLILTFFCLATFYVMLDAPFMAAIQVIVYAGAIVVLTLIEIIYFLNRSWLAESRGGMSKELIEHVGHTELIGMSMFTEFLLP